MCRVLGDWYSKAILHPFLTENLILTSQDLLLTMKLIYAPPLLPLFQVIDAEWIGTEDPIFTIL